MVKYSKIRNIIKGTFFNVLRKEQELADKRIPICKKCEHIENTKLGDICGLCGCILESKTRVEDEHCELNKW